ITRPWLAEWEQTKETIAAALQRARSARAPAARTRAQNEAAAAYRAFLDRLRAFRVLDPACGSGNFLYLALLALKDIEHRAAVEAETLGLPRELPQVGPQAVKGIEINPYAAELARVTVWIGEIQWMLRNGFGAGRDPILKPLDTIECRDAILDEDGSEAAWPAADVVIGNPPFLGNKAMLSTMGQSDVRRLRGAFAGRLPGGVDLVTYWFEKARALLEAKHLRRAGLVATQAIRRGANRNVLDRIAAVATIFDAWADEPWILDGAAVRVSLVCFGQDGAGSALCLNGQPVSAIHTDLSSGSIDLTVAARLRENAGICFQGPVKVGPFDISGDLAREWLQLPLNPNGRGNADVVRPWLNGRDLTDRPSDTWIVDFNEMSESEAALYEAPFEYVRATVKPFRDTNNRVRRRRFWWQHGETVPGLRSKAARLSRLIGTPRVAKHRLFLWIAPQALPDSRINVIARDEDTVFGLLHSRFHEAWALGLGSRHGDGSEGGRPTYNNETCFGTYPFPDGLTPDRPAAEYAADPRALAIAAAA
ncbi:MAG: class I SAM-dependent DNA methyltransferase, partial [Acetobacteraceae bacterium]